MIKHLLSSSIASVKASLEKRQKIFFILPLQIRRPQTTVFTGVAAFFDFFGNFSFIVSDHNLPKRYNRALWRTILYAIDPFNRKKKCKKMRRLLQFIGPTTCKKQFTKLHRMFFQSFDSSLPLLDGSGALGLI